MRKHEEKWESANFTELAYILLLSIQHGKQITTKIANDENEQWSGFHCCHHWQCRYFVFFLLLASRQPMAGRSAVLLRAKTAPKLPLLLVLLPILLERHSWRMSLLPLRRLSLRLVHLMPHWRRRQILVVLLLVLLHLLLHRRRLLLLPPPPIISLLPIHWMAKSWS